MTVVEREVEQEASRTKRLRAATHAAHERLDTFIMGSGIFESRGHYGRFVKTQYRFHRDLDALWFDPRLDALLPDLHGRRRLAMIEQDLADLGLALPESMADPAFSGAAPADMPEALGWLYVVEGSNLGAAFLLKDAAKLGLGEEFGARHLAGAPQGRGLHWRTFAAALDAFDLGLDEETRAVDAAVAAFARVEAYARAEMAGGSRASSAAK